MADFGSLGAPFSLHLASLGSIFIYWRLIYLIQALRAFRRAEIIFDVVLFDSCVGGVAAAMTVASIFYFEFGSFGVSF